MTADKPIPTFRHDGQPTLDLFDVADRGARRERIAEVLMGHWRTPTSGCMCGQVELGQSWPLHVADELLSGPLAPLLDRAP